MFKVLKIVMSPFNITGIEQRLKMSVYSCQREPGLGMKDSNTQYI